MVEKVRFLDQGAIRQRKREQGAHEKYLVLIQEKVEMRKLLLGLTLFSCVSVFANETQIVCETFKRCISVKQPCQYLGISGHHDSYTNVDWHTSKSVTTQLDTLNCVIEDGTVSVIKKLHEPKNNYSYKDVKDFNRESSLVACQERVQELLKNFGECK